VADRPGGLAFLLVQPGEVEVGVGRGGIGGDGLLVGRDGLRDPSQVLERDPQVEGRDGIVRARGQRQKVVVGRRQRMATLVEQPSA
jgi:hypothetical protein